MSLSKQSRNLLNSKKASITNPRLVVLGLLLQEGRPLTIEQLLKLSKGKLAQSTLYRVINDLREFDLITEFTTPENTIVVELNTEDSNHHHHIFCEKCGRIIDIELDSQLEDDIEKEVSNIEGRYSLSIRGHSLELIGICDTCNLKN
tara:strand:+ start:2059 stop:2499 length:441 start_codon:yes stop_codon:yes gene_type:complete